MKIPQVSVVVCNYNNEKYLPQCLDSILMQTILPNEIIIADDCSTDASLSIISNYAEKFEIVKVILNIKNLGVAKSRDKAIRVASSEYITTLDSDDFYMNGKIENEIKSLINNPNSISYSDIIDVNEDGQLILERKNKIIEGDNSFKRVEVCFTGKKENRFKDIMFPKAAYIKVNGINNRYPIFEDLDLYLRLNNEIQSWCHSGAVGTAYRQLDSGLSRSKSRFYKFKIKMEILLQNGKYSEKKFEYLYLIFEFFLVSIQKFLLYLLKNLMETITTGVSLQSKVE